MRLAVFFLTRPGLEIALRLGKAFSKIDYFTTARLMDDTGRFQPFQGGLAATVAKVFRGYEGIIFISAVAVAVRVVAPHLLNKALDPAVVVVDEGGCFAISLLSGHLGGANALAKKVASCLGATPIITTATDGRGLLAFDELARRSGWSLENLSDLKQISAAQLEGREIILYTEQELKNFPLKAMGGIRVTRRPEDLIGAKNGVVLLSDRRKMAFPPLKGPGSSETPDIPYIIMRPRSVAAGVGCRKGVPAGRIIAAIEAALEEADLAPGSLGCLATGVFKGEEAGLLQAAQHFRVPLKVYTREEILPWTKGCRTSLFVQEQVGVGAVAEPCACLGSNGGRVVLPCRRGKGITVSLARGSFFPEHKKDEQTKERKQWPVER